VTRKLSGTEQKRLHRSWRRATASRVALLLDDVQTPFNVGSIVRTAAAFRVEHLYLTERGAVPSAPGARKTSLGTERYLTWSVHPDGAAAVDAAAGDGYHVIGIELVDAAAPIHELEIDGDVCLALGHEERGLSAATLEKLDTIAYVPLAGRVGSLNVAVAAAIATYDVRRRSWTVTGPDLR
jgi:tRNA (guanosine-2'-O-)-methyltransferase